MPISLGNGRKLGITSTQVSPEEAKNLNGLAMHKDFKSIVKYCPVRRGQDQPASLLKPTPIFFLIILNIKLFSKKLSVMREFPRLFQRDQH